MTGSILRGIGSFYTVLCDEDGQEYTLRAQKKLRHQKMTPMVGDRVRFTPGQGGEDGWLEEILPRKSMMERPSVANVDMLMLVVASVPQPDMLLCDKLILRAEKGGMIPAICVNKIDLGDELAEQIRREYVGTQLRVFSVSAREGTGVSQLARQGHLSGGAIRRGQKLAAQRAVRAGAGNRRAEPQDRARAAHDAARGDDGRGRHVRARYAGVQPAGAGKRH